MTVRLSRPIFDQGILGDFSEILLSGKLAQGERVATFEDYLTQLTGVKNVVSVNSGTSALLAALWALELPPGSEVIVPSFTFAATANAAAFLSLKPVFVDIDPTTYNLDVEAILDSISPRTSAIIPVHLYGRPFDILNLKKHLIRENKDIKVVEDAAQAILAELNGKQVGSMGDIAAFSFYATKNLALGEGGAISTSDDTLARRVKLFRNQGMERRYENEVVGLNLRMTELQAAIGVRQVTTLENETRRREEIANFYSDAFREIDLITPEGLVSGRHVFHQYTVRVQHGRRDSLQSHLAACGVESAVYYPRPVHMLPAFGSCGREYCKRKCSHLPQTDRAANEVLSIPVNPALTDSDLDQVCSAVVGFFK